MQNLRTGSKTQSAAFARWQHAPSPAHLERHQVGRSDAKSSGGLLADHCPRWHTRVRLRANDGDAKASGAQRLGSALTLRTDEIGHHIRRRLLSTIEQEGHLWRVG